MHKFCQFAACAVTLFAASGSYSEGSYSWNSEASSTPTRQNQNALAHHQSESFSDLPSALSLNSEQLDLLHEYAVSFTSVQNLMINLSANSFDQYGDFDHDKMLEQMEDSIYFFEQFHYFKQVFFNSLSVDQMKQYFDLRRSIQQAAEQY